MKEKDLDQKINQEETKLKWEAPKLFCLDKGKTEGGRSVYPPFEDDTYTPS